MDWRDHKLDSLPTTWSLVVSVHPAEFLQTQLRKRKILLQPPSTTTFQVTRANALLFEGSVVGIDAYSIALVQKQETRKNETMRTTKEKRIVNKLRQQIVYEDEHFVVLNKPEGLAVQVDRYKGSRQPSIASRLYGERVESLDRYVPALAESLYVHDEHKALPLVHRLDKETSGVLVLSRARLAAAKCSTLLQRDVVHKSYEALVATTASSPMHTYRRLKELEGRELKLPVDTKAACTVLERVRLQTDGTEPMGTWLQLRPLTGRKHQLRVHCAHVLNSPILGDTKYGGARATRLYLHAARIRFPDPFTVWKSHSDLMRLEVARWRLRPLELIKTCRLGT
ncbi:hypothetical protein PsorP6_017501 [Peronosclerospora sorghi]|uniref:Uncharacterized protein n=1 Tax=Peronosclerospora sorghi TaxID=230839 RepID=A0ACC0WMK8_9STRA|nr:hypothetical protein PsorP6_017501 [Peronosclerospora sorghi]